NDGIETVNDVLDVAVGFDFLQKVLELLDDFINCSLVPERCTEQVDTSAIHDQNLAFGVSIIRADDGRKGRPAHLAPIEAFVCADLAGRFHQVLQVRDLNARNLDPGISDCTYVTSL